ncbi:hypothetical protein COV20_00140 [Candidatus Woesearchaeota archaeon CG10_big_fil_rev_8_21_14_0_10_45_16]|nr:MAG: hypothetical protein COV20_00140 [Candidatus Woesearchaeota archaeon CG10_big_fil_rev_8_21_14_0_10_45_16]
MIPELLEALTTDSLFQEWQQRHGSASLSHFFAQINAKLELKSSWEIGYYEKDADKITVFRQLDHGFEIKPADDVFKKDDAVVEQLSLDSLNVHFEKAQEIAREKFPELFPKETLGDGFVILQAFKEQVLWNFTVISKSLQFLNVKIGADSGNVESHQAVSLVQS